MTRRFLLAVSLTALMLSSGSVFAQASSKPPAAAKVSKPFNIGFVLYTKGKAPGTLDARWNYANVYSGHGVATGGPASGGFGGPRGRTDSDLPHPAMGNCSSTNKCLTTPRVLACLQFPARKFVTRC